MAMNGLNGVWLNTYILQIIILEELERLRNYKLNINHNFKVRDIQKIQRKNFVRVSVIG